MTDWTAFDFDPDTRLYERLLILAADARDALAPEEYARRSAWCDDHGDGRLHLGHDDNDVILTWGGTMLVTVDEHTLRSLRDDDEPHVVLAEPPDLPDDVGTLM
jgi:hypothetical protein